jgi:uncharacterized protein YmfQ (DUF2313 family)
MDPVLLIYLIFIPLIAIGLIYRKAKDEELEKYLASKKEEEKIKLDKEERKKTQLMRDWERIALKAWDDGNKILTNSHNQNEYIIDKVYYTGRKEAFFLAVANKIGEYNKDENINYKIEEKLEKAKTLYSQTQVYTIKNKAAEEETKRYAKIVQSEIKILKTWITNYLNNLSNSELSKILEILERGKRTDLYIHTTSDKTILGEIRNTDLLKVYTGTQEIQSSHKLSQIINNEIKKRENNAQKKAAENEKQFSKERQDRWMKLLNSYIEHSILSETNKGPGLYCIFNRKDYNYYLGSTIDLSKRKYHHLFELKNNKHHSYKLQEAFNKYGIDSFDFYCLKMFSLKNYTQDSSKGYNYQEWQLKNALRNEEKCSN